MDGEESVPFAAQGYNTGILWGTHQGTLARAFLGAADAAEPIEYVEIVNRQEDTLAPGTNNQYFYQDWLYDVEVWVGTVSDPSSINLPEVETEPYGSLCALLTLGFYRRIIGGFDGYRLYVNCYGAVGNAVTVRQVNQIGTPLPRWPSRFGNAQRYLTFNQLRLCHVDPSSISSSELGQIGQHGQGDGASSGSSGYELFWNSTAR